MTIIDADINAAGKSFAIVAAKWNARFVDKLIEGARETLLEHGADEDKITLVKVPGSYEVPFTSYKLAETKKYDAIIALGLLIEGETDHYRLIAEEVASGLSKVSFDTGVPVSFGVLTCKNVAQAEARSGSGSSNKGRESALAAIEMTSLVSKITESDNIKNVRVVGER